MSEATRHINGDSSQGDPLWLLKATGGEAERIIEDAVMEEVSKVAPPTYTGIKQAAQELKKMFDGRPHLESKISSDELSADPLKMKRVEKYFKQLFKLSKHELEKKFEGIISPNEISADPPTMESFGEYFMESFGEYFNELSRIRKNIDSDDLYPGKLITKAYYLLAGASMLIPDQLMPKFVPISSLLLPPSSQAVEELNIGNLTVAELDIDNLSVTVEIGVSNIIPSIWHELTHLAQIIRRVQFGDIFGIRPDIVASILVYFPRFTTEDLSFKKELEISESLRKWREEFYPQRNEILRRIRSALKNIQQPIPADKSPEEISINWFINLGNNGLSFWLNHISGHYAGDDIFNIIDEIEAYKARARTTHPREIEAISKENKKLQSGNDILTIETESERGCLNLPPNSKARDEFIKEIQKKAEMRKNEILAGKSEGLGFSLQITDLSFFTNMGILELIGGINNPQAIRNNPFLKCYSPQTLNRLEEACAKAYEAAKHVEKVEKLVGGFEKK